jgi:hypothetical protein
MHAGLWDRGTQAATIGGAQEVTMRSPLRILTLLVGGFFALQGVGWLASPARAAAALAMPLLDGLGRSTQVGDFAAFFLAIGAATIFGARPGRAPLLLVPAGILAAAAVSRTIAWAAHGAGFATAAITVELICAAFLAFASHRLDARAGRA